MGNDSVVEFGRIHTDIVVALEALVGGLGPYDDPRLILDAASRRSDLPELYDSPLCVDVHYLGKELMKADEEGKPEIEAELLRAQHNVWKGYNFEA